MRLVLVLLYIFDIEPKLLIINKSFWLGKFRPIRVLKDQRIINRFQKRGNSTNKAEDKITEGREYKEERTKSRAEIDED